MSIAQSIAKTLGITITGGSSNTARALRRLRALGSSAHVWAPGANNAAVATLPSNNYLLSDGSTGYSTVDGVDGLTLDGMGSLGSELVTNGTFPDTTGWATAGGYGTVSAVAGELVVTSSATGMWAYTSITTVVGQTHKLVGTGRRGTVVSSPQFGVTTTLAGTPSPLVTFTTTSNETKELYFVATGTTTYVCVRFSAIENGATAYFDNISVKEYTGTRLTQPTTANKPLVRRGMLNELLNSASPATQSVTCIAAPYTLALYGTGNVVLSGTGAGTLTGTGASDLVVLNFTPTAGSVTFTKAGTVSSFGLFKGTWTAAQILAEGGIPNTTATAASNPSAGKYWWSFNGSKNSLLSGNLGITNACTIVIAGRVDSLAPGLQMLCTEDTNGAQIYINNAGRIYFSETGVSDLVFSAAGVIVAGVPFVITARLSGGNVVLRLNGVQIATAVTGETFSAITGVRLGTDFAGTGHPLNGALGWVIPSAVGLSDADCLTVERLVGSQFPGMAVF